MPRTAITTPQRKRARSLRLNQTGTEQALWHMLKGGQMLSVHFRRQVPLGHYVADFASHGDKLVIEVDGDHHGWHRERRRDQERDRCLASQGYRVLRFSNGEVLKERQSVSMTIEAAVQHQLPVEVYAAVPEAYVAFNDLPPSLSLPHKGGENAETSAEFKPSPPVGEGWEGAI